MTEIGVSVPARKNHPSPEMSRAAVHVSVVLLSSRFSPLPGFDSLLTKRLPDST